MSIDLKEYFENSEGTGILATADAEGEVDTAIYARPHIVDDNTVGLLMKPRLSYQNLLANSNASYMFIERGPGYKGWRLYLRKVREESDPDIIEQIRRKPTHSESDSNGQSSNLVYFEVEKVRPLIGD